MKYAVIFSIFLIGCSESKGTKVHYAYYEDTQSVTAAKIILHSDGAFEMHQSSAPKSNLNDVVIKTTCGVYGGAGSSFMIETDDQKIFTLKSSPIYFYTYPDFPRVQFSEQSDKKSQIDLIFISSSCD